MGTVTARADNQLLARRERASSDPITDDEPLAPAPAGAEHAAAAD